MKTSFLSDYLIDKKFDKINHNRTLSQTLKSNNCNEKPQNSKKNLEYFLEILNNKQKAFQSTKWEGCQKNHSVLNEKSCFINEKVNFVEKSMLLTKKTLNNENCVKNEKKAVFQEKSRFLMSTSRIQEKKQENIEKTSIFDRNNEFSSFFRKKENLSEYSKNRSFFDKKLLFNDPNKDQEKPFFFHKTEKMEKNEEKSSFLKDFLEKMKKNEKNDENAKKLQFLKDFEENERFLKTFENFDKKEENTTNYDNFVKKPEVLQEKRISLNKKQEKCDICLENPIFKENLKNISSKFSSSLQNLLNHRKRLNFDENEAECGVFPNEFTIKKIIKTDKFELFFKKIHSFFQTKQRIYLKISLKTMALNFYCIKYQEIGKKIDYFTYLFSKMKKKLLFSSFFKLKLMKKYDFIKNVKKQWNTYKNANLYENSKNFVDIYENPLNFLKNEVFIEKHEISHEKPKNSHSNDISYQNPHNQGNTYKNKIFNEIPRDDETLKSPKQTTNQYMITFSKEIEFSLRNSPCFRGLIERNIENTENLPNFDDFLIKNSENTYKNIEKFNKTKSNNTKLNNAKLKKGKKPKNKGISIDIDNIEDFIEKKCFFQQNNEISFNEKENMPIESLHNGNKKKKELCKTQNKVDSDESEGFLMKKITERLIAEASSLQLFKKK